MSAQGPTAIPEPLLFISHKHKDSSIGQVLAAFIEEKSGARVKVFLSSDPSFQGPKLGKNLNAQLRDALWNSDVLLLIYTSEEEDWQYCMYECGVATDRHSPDTKIIVFQCGADVPSAFEDIRRVNALSLNDVRQFVDELLRDPTFFPKRNGAALSRNLRDSIIESHATELHKNLESVIPKPKRTLERRALWPYLRVEMPAAEVNRIEQEEEVSRKQLAHQLVRDYAVVVDTDANAAQLFGKGSFTPRMKFEGLLKIWKDKYPTLEPSWFDSACDQIMAGAVRGLPVISMTPMREVGGEAEYTPVLSRVSRLPDDVVHFDLYLLNLSDPNAVPVAARMIPAGKFFFKNIDQLNPQTLKLRDLVNELEMRGLNRIPLLNGSSHPMYMVHRSMIDKFIVQSVLSGDAGRNLNDLTLADLLADPQMRAVFEETFVVVKRQATLAEARSAMVARPGCSDVFVTSGGGRDEPVQGWLTNVDIAKPN
jgi:hypothetical protein